MQARTPYFSVVIPVYNRAHSIGVALRSVLAQTFQDFEVIVVDDGSTDDLASAVAQIGDDRIRLIRQENSGANVARNRGIDNARGTYVALLDSDDEFLPHHLSAAAEVHRRDPDVVIYSRVVVDRGDGRTFMKPPRPMRVGEHMAEYLLCDHGFLPTITLVLPTALARSVRYDETLPFGQDTDFAIRLYDAGARFLMLEEPSAVWHDTASPDRVSARQTPDVRARWLESARPRITTRAYYGCRGWYLAKALARHGSLGRALAFYLSATLRGCYSPRMALVVGMQVLIPPSFYRKLADSYLRVRMLRPRSA